MFFTIFSTFQKLVARAIFALCFFICVSSQAARAADIYYEVYSGESVRIVVNMYGQNSVVYDYPNGIFGTARGAPDSTADLIYTSNAGFVGTQVITSTAYIDPVTWTVAGSDTSYITVKPRVSFSDSSWPDAQKDVPYSASVTANYSAGSNVITYSVPNGSLPPGLSLDSATGKISGTPTEAGSWTFHYEVRNGDGYTGAQSMTLRVGPEVINASATLAANTTLNNISIDLPGNYDIYATAGASHGSSSYSAKALLYTPTAGYSGSDSFSFWVRDSTTGLMSIGTASITITPPTLSLSPGTIADAKEGVIYAVVLTASAGTSPYTYEITEGSAPAGLQMTAEGVIQGIPLSDGSYTFKVKATDAYGATGTQQYTLQVEDSAPAVADVETTIDANSTGREIALSITGTTQSVIVMSVPAHGTVTTNGTQLSYRPTQGYSGTDSFTYIALNQYGTSAASATVTIRVLSNGLTFSPQTLPDGTVSSSYNTGIYAIGGTAPYTFVVTSGSLPAGLTLATDGTLSGIPTSVDSQTFTVTATDIYGATGSQSYTVAIAIAAPVAGDASATVAANSSNNAITLTLSGGTTSTVAIETAPGHGIATASGAAISYTPTPGYSGSDSFTYIATNATGTSAAATVTITVTAPTLALSPSGRLTLRENEAFSQAFTASNGGAPYSYTMTGSLPAGLSFNAASATLSGTPTASGEFPLTLTATDAYGASASTSVVLAIGGALPVAPSISSVATSGLTTTVDLTEGATGGPFLGADLVSLSPPSAGTATIILGDTAATDGSAAIATAIREGRYRLRFTASPTFSGSVVATYTLTSASGVSAPATITFSVTARPDLSADADLAGLVKAQAEAAKRLADSQIDNVQQHLKSLRGGKCLENSLGINLTDSADGQAPVSASAGCSPIAGGDLAFWSGGSVDLGDTSGKDGASDIEHTTVSLTVGLDYRLTDTFIGGVAIGFSRDRSDIGDNGTTSVNKAASATLYGLYQPGGGFFIDGLLGGGLLDFDSLRITSMTGQEAEASRSGRQFYAALTGGYDYRIGEISLSSYGRLSGSRSILDSVEENGTDWENALIGRQQADSLTATLGLSLGYDIDLETTVLTPELTLDFSHDFLSSSDTTVTYADSGWPIDYVVPGSDSSRDRLTVGFGLTLAASEAATMTGRYSATLDRDGLQSQRFNVDLSRRF